MTTTGRRRAPTSPRTSLTDWATDMRMNGSPGSSRLASPPPPRCRRAARPMRRSTRRSTRCRQRSRRSSHSAPHPDAARQGDGLSSRPTDRVSPVQEGNERRDLHRRAHCLGAGRLRNDIYIPLCYDAVGTATYLRVMMDAAVLRARGMGLSPSRRRSSGGTERRRIGRRRRRACRTWSRRSFAPSDRPT